MNKIFSNGVYRSLSDLKLELKIWYRHIRNSKKAKKLSGSKLNKLHLGCGQNHKPGWLNVDIFPPADLTLDLREEFPFPDVSFSLIYSEHFFEHIEYPTTAKLFLSECNRVLKKDGKIRLAVPDTVWPMMEYCGVSNNGYFNIAKEDWHPDWCTTNIEHINYHFRQDGEHKFAYDFETLEKILLLTGFINIEQTEFQVDIDSEARKKGTLYINAIKA